jgi:putative DNA methylase
MREFQKALSKELRPALEKMQSSSIAPVDLAQSAIGPGMAVYSRYSAVLRSDGTPVTIREALEMINQEIDIVFNAQDQRFDAETRFCLTVFEQYAFNDMKFGDANTLANAKNTSVERVASLGALQAGKGTVYLYPLEELPPFAPAFSD